MTATSYLPGTWLGIVRSRTAVLLGPDTPPSLVEAVWTLLADGPGVHEVLHAVTGSSGGSLAMIPPFAILDSQGPLRVFLRGDLDLTVQSPGGPVELNGRDVTTWTERRLDAPGTCRLTVPGAGPAAPAGTTGQRLLPLGEGVVLLQALVIGAEAAAARGHVVAASPLLDAAAPPAPDAGASPPAGRSMPEAAIVSEHGVSGETLYAVIDDDAGMDQAAYGPVPEAEPEAAGQAESSSDAAGDPDARPGPDDEGHSVSVHGDAAPASDMTGSYDHLWERTVMRNIEDAAVREELATDDGQLPAQQPQAVEPPAPLEAPAPPAPLAALEPAVDAPKQGNPVLIDSVPWRRGEAAANATAPNTAALNVAAPDMDGDHDGQTVMKSSLQKPANPGAAAPASPVAGPAAGPTVLARICGQGHPNPPTSALCAACGSGLLPDAVQVARPRLGRMRISTGELIELDQSLVIGRQPSVSRVQGGGMPRLLQVPSPGGDISRSHVEVRLEGWHVMLCDLKATNGTVLVREGQPPRRLAQNEMAILLDGDIAELGDDISLRFEEIL